MLLPQQQKIMRPYPSSSCRWCPSDHCETLSFICANLMRARGPTQKTPEVPHTFPWWGSIFTRTIRLHPFVPYFRGCNFKITGCARKGANFLGTKWFTVGMWEFFLWTDVGCPLEINFFVSTAFRPMAINFFFVTGGREAQTGLLGKLKKGKKGCKAAHTCEE